MKVSPNLGVANSGGILCFLSGGSFFFSDDGKHRMTVFKEFGTDV